MKKWIALLLIMMFACAPAHAMERSAQPVNFEWLQRYASFEEEGGVWSVRSNRTQAAINRMGAVIAPYEGYACFGLELTGDKDTGLIVPVLAFYYAGTQKLNGRYASIAVGDTRWDIQLHREEITLGVNRGERLTAPMDDKGLEMIQAMIGAGDDFTAAITGDSTLWIEPERKAAYMNTQEELAVCSADGMSEMQAEFFDIGEYRLWDLNAAWWERMYGMKPAMQKVKLPAEKGEIGGTGVRLEGPMFMLSRGDTGAPVRAVQEMLIEAGYMLGKADGAYGEGTVKAVAAMQKIMGLMPTGCADSAMLTLLDGGGWTVEQPETISMKTAEMHTAEGLCALTVERHWLADAVESEGGDRRSVSDRDDTLLIYEGTVKNLSAEELDFYWQLQASVRTGGYEYPCVLACERNEGDTLTGALPPQGEARLLIWAQVPEQAAEECEWTLSVRAGETVIEID